MPYFTSKTSQILRPAIPLISLFQPTELEKLEESNFSKFFHVSVAQLQFNPLGCAIVSDDNKKIYKIYYCHRFPEHEEVARAASGILINALDFEPGFFADSDQPRIPAYFPVPELSFDIGSTSRDKPAEIPDYELDL